MDVLTRLANSIVVPVVVLDKVEDAVPTEVIGERLEARIRKMSWTYPTHFSCFSPLASCLSPSSIAAATEPAVGICLSAMRLPLLRAMERFRHIPLRDKH